ncbi:uncharacterized protein FIBRA_07391 [Fibroporia radiculosa]|uniref:Uncharacterized protein n=1 Tax=Fibroporia radiculosa TaxID=599839 RepID=J4I0L5_9APHY|nr:uncharacterized protein FIBRA_07391 [Fibroporia radiculosa]CCM05182.1 predicted protein [Fibroporia radiculosa]
MLEGRIQALKAIEAMATALPDIKQLLGLSPSSSELTAHITILENALSEFRSASPEVKSYPDAVYFNYYPLGLSLLFKPVNGYKPKTELKVEDLNAANLILDGIDIYNGLKSGTTSGSGSRLKSVFSSYPISPLVLTLCPGQTEGETKSRPSFIEINRETTGKAFVESMGEPERKGGGAGPSSGSIGIWCEWSRDGVMVEFGGDESRGLQAWERGKDAVWKVITVFPPKFGRP